MALPSIRTTNIPCTQEDQSGSGNGISYMLPATTHEALNNVKIFKYSLKDIDFELFVNKACYKI